MLKLSTYLVDNWMRMDVLDNGQRIIKKEKAYSAINNYVLNSVTNLVENTRKHVNSLNFSPILSKVALPYDEIESNFIKVINNGAKFIVPAQMTLR